MRRRSCHAEVAEQRVGDQVALALKHFEFQARMLDGLVNAVRCTAKIGVCLSVVIVKK